MPVSEMERNLLMPPNLEVTIMKSALLFLLACCLSSLSTAAPIVLGNSSYSVYLRGSQSLDQATFTAQFDGVNQNYVRAGLDLVIDEAQTLVAGRNRITIGLSANGDLFPSQGEAAVMGLGASDGNGLEFDGPAYLYSALIRAYVGDQLLGTTSNLADDYRNVYFSGAWNGQFANFGTAFSIGNAGGVGISRFEFEFLVEDFNAVPAPTTLLLSCLALLLLGAQQGRRLEAR